jgi:hypothetical protein
MPRLVFHSDDLVQSLELKPGVNRIGRTEENDFQIEHETISSLHCEVVVDGATVLVRDCGSTNGTFIHGQRIFEASLQMDETLRLGDVELVLKPPLPRVALPHVDFRQPPPPPPLADGSAPCLYHGERPADYQCTRCQKTFCADCIHDLHRVGGRPRKFCPACSGPCRPLRPVEKQQKRSFLGFLRFLDRLTSRPSKPAKPPPPENPEA